MLQYLHKINHKTKNQSESNMNQIRTMRIGVNILISAIKKKKKKLRCKSALSLKVIFKMILITEFVRVDKTYTGQKQQTVIVSTEAYQCRHEHCKLHVCDQHVTFLCEVYGWLLV